jgi:hypothetical protein
MTMTGLPAACAPSGAVRVATEVADNGTSVVGIATIDSAQTTVVFSIDQPFSATGFTNSGNKGLSPGWQIEYAL